MMIRWSDLLNIHKFYVIQIMWTRKRKGIEVNIRSLFHQLVAISEATRAAVEVVRSLSSHPKSIILQARSCWKHEIRSPTHLVMKMRMRKSLLSKSETRPKCSNTTKIRKRSQSWLMSTLTTLSAIGVALKRISSTKRDRSVKRSPGISAPPPKARAQFARILPSHRNPASLRLSMSPRLSPATKTRATCSLRKPGSSATISSTKKKHSSPSLWQSWALVAAKR